MQPNERALLTMLVARLRQIDADVFVGHNFAAFDLDVLLHRLQHHKVCGLPMCLECSRVVLRSRNGQRGEWKPLSSELS